MSEISVKELKHPFLEWVTKEELLELIPKLQPLKSFNYRQKVCARQLRNAGAVIDWGDEMRFHPTRTLDVINAHIEEVLIKQRS